jgi:hypothetical protein
MLEAHESRMSFKGLQLVVDLKKTEEVSVPCAAFRLRSSSSSSGSASTSGAVYLGGVIDETRVA